MTKTISELWNGNLSPIIHLGRNNIKMKRLEATMYPAREKLEEIFDKEQKEIFEKYNECMNDYILAISEQSFCQGFSLATKITSEALNAAEEML